MSIEQVQATLYENYINVIVAFAGSSVILLIEFYFCRCPFLHCLDADVRWIPNHGIKSTFFHDFWKFFFPVEGIDAISLLLVKEIQLFALVKIRADQGIAAFDIASQIRQGTFLEQLHLPLKGVLILSFKDFEKQAQLGDLNCL